MSKPNMKNRPVEGKKGTVLTADHIHEDLRKIDIRFLNKYDVCGWDSVWEGVYVEEGLCHHAGILPDSNQSHWHLSRISYLCGYLFAKGRTIDEVREILKENLRLCKK